MSKNSKKNSWEPPQIAPIESTGGAGSEFENHVVSWFATLMACDGRLSLCPQFHINEIVCQVRWRNILLDDMKLVLEDNKHHRKQFLSQIKRKVSFTASDKDFRETIHTAWSDFKKSQAAPEDGVVLSLITGPLNRTDNDRLGQLTDYAKNNSSSDDFVSMIRFSEAVSIQVKTLYETICNLIAKQEGSPVPYADVHAFLRQFQVLLPDTLSEDGLLESFAVSLLKQTFPGFSAYSIFNGIYRRVEMLRSRGGLLTRENLLKWIKERYGVEPRENRRFMQKPIRKRTPREQPNPAPSQGPEKQERTAFRTDHLALFSLLGTWLNEDERDRQAVLRILGVNEESLEDYQQTLSQKTPPAVSIENGLVRVNDRCRTWKATATTISKVEIERFLIEATAHLKRIDKKLDLNPERRSFSEIDSGLMASSVLRRGLAEGVAILGVHSDCCKKASLNARRKWAPQAIKGILDGANWKTWATLDELLPFLAEAAPDEYLACVERFLRKKKDGMESLFAQERSGIMGRTYLWGFLEALQRLAWLPEFFAAVLDILARLAKLDPGGQWGPRPVAVMQRILHPYGAHTTVEAPMRLEVVSALLKKYPEQLWDVLVSLLPSGGYSFVEDANEPVYRRPPNMKKVGEGVPLAEAFDQFDRYEILAVGLCGTNADRMTRLIDSAVEDWRNEPYQTLADHLERNVRKLSAEQRYSVWEKLRGKYRYLRMQTAKAGENQEWFKKRDDSVAALIRLYEPSDPQYKYLPLFNLAAEYEEQDSSGRSRKEVAADIERRRRDAVEEIWKTAGTEALLAFASRSELSQLIGKFFGEIASADVDSELLPGKLRFDITGDYWPIAGYVAGRFAKGGWAWVEGLVLTDWSTEQRAMLLVLLPFNEHTWNRLHSFFGDDESLYWRHVDVRGRMHGNDVEAAVSGLLKYGCFFTAADALSFSSLGEKLPRADLSRRILSAFVENHAQDKPSSLSSYHIEQMIRSVQQSPDVDAKEKVRYEWHFFKLFERGGHRDFSPVALNKELANNPKLFCEALKLAYLTSKEAKDPQSKRKAKPRSETESRRAENAWRLLHGWDIVPGVDEKGSFDEKRFRKWVKEAFALAKKIDRLEAAKMVLGGVAIHAPECSDFWMPHAFAQLMERPGNEQMLNAFESAKFNSRGVYWVDKTMKADRELADQYEQKALQADRFGYLGLARAMRNIAKSTMYMARLDKEEHDRAEVENRILREEKTASKPDDN